MTQSYSNQYNADYKTYLSKTYMTVALGLGISAISAFIASIILPIMMYRAPMFFFVLMIGMIIGEFAIAINFSARLFTMSKKSAWACYIGYSVLTGLSFYTLFLYYDLGSVALAFFSTLVMFVCMAIIGKTAKFNVYSVYGLLLPAVLAGAITTLLNALIFHSPMIDLFISFAGIILFLFMTAADAKKVQDLYNQSQYDKDLSDKLMIMSAMQLYLDFINIFVRVLRFMGRRRNDN